MPRRDEIECRVCPCEVASVQHADETFAADKEVRRDEVAVAHDVRPGSRQLPKLRPYRPQPRNVHQALAFLEAEPHPLIVVGQVPASSVTAELPATGIGCPQGIDQHCKVLRECRR